jgi:hypothetical protein
MSSDWQCSAHGVVHPFFTHRPEALPQLTASANVPVWCPLPLPTGWTAGGIGACGDERTGSSATVVALAGPSPLGGPADLLLVAEEPGVGLGASLAGTQDLDPGMIGIGQPDAKVLAAGHPSPLWRCASADDRIAFVGEASGVWLWAVLWPPAAELVLIEHLDLHDLRHSNHAALVLPVGAPSPRLP